MFIKLTKGIESIYVNVNKVFYLSQCMTNKKTLLEMTNNNFVTVNESPEEILQLIKGTYLNV